MNQCDPPFEKSWLRPWYEIEYEFQTSDVSRVLVLFMLVLGRESSSWDDLGVCCDNVKPEN